MLLIGSGSCCCSRLFLVKLGAMITPKTYNDCCLFVLIVRVVVVTLYHSMRQIKPLQCRVVEFVPFSSNVTCDQAFFLFSAKSGTEAEVKSGKFIDRCIPFIAFVCKQRNKTHG